MEFRILGPLEVRNARGAVALGGIKPRAVLAVLLLHANEPVSAERLALALWGEEAPSGAVRTVQVHVSRLRKALGDADVLETTPVGYRLHVRPGELDAERFELLVEDGRRALVAGQVEHAATVLREALSMWRGPALADVAYEPFAQAEVARLEEQRLSALEARIDADLAAGRHGELLDDLPRLLATHPTRERLVGQLMLALYRCGRQAEALEVYLDARRMLVADVGVEPGPELQRLQEAILRHDASLELQHAVADLPPELDARAAPALVGRRDEIAWLRLRWERACQGAGGLVTLAGVSGSGKLRLAAELATVAHDGGAAVLYATGSGPAETFLSAVRRTRQTTRPMLLVIDAVDRADPEGFAELEALSRSLEDLPVLVLACGGDVEVLADLRSDGVLVLDALDAAAVAAIACQYAPGTAVEDVPADWLLEASGGIPGVVHEVASQWARREAARYVGAVAGRAAAGREELRSIQAELTGGVEDLQEARERILPRRFEAPVVCPFKGLASFDVADAPYFFGREKLVAELVAQLVGAHLLGIVGPSGSGKSSVMRAGLLPALAAGVLPGSDAWKQVLIRPGEHPLRELTDAMAVIDDGDHAVVAIDQCEEVFTTCEDEAERAAFIAELTRMADERHGRCVVVIALRADFYGRCAAYPGLAGPLAANHVLVSSMQRDELRRAIELPARRVGLRVDPELADALVADVKDEPGALPLLSTALLELWQRRDGRRLRHTVYEQSGGVRGAVARLAEEAFHKLDGEQQLAARDVLMRLAREGAAGGIERRRVAMAELETDRSDHVASVVALLTDRRLLTVSAGTIELAHEALLREWPRLRDWINDDLDGLRIHRNLNAAACEWEKLGRDEGALYRGVRFTETVEWQDARAPSLNETEREFLAASDARHQLERKQRRRRVMLAFSSLITVLVAISIVAIMAVSQSREARLQRDIAASRSIAARSADFVASDPQLSLALAFQALLRRKTDAAQNALRQAALTDRTRAIWPVSRTGPAYGIAISHDGALLATTGDDGTVRVRNVDSGRIVTTITHDEQPVVALRPVLAASFSPNDRTIAITGIDGEIAVADIATGRRSPVARLGKEAFGLTVQFSHDGKSLLVGTRDGRVAILPLRKRTKLRRLPESGTVAIRASYSNDGTRVVGASVDGMARIWRVAGGAPVKLRAGGPLYAAAFDRGNKHVATAGQGGYVQIWDVDRPGSPLRKIFVDGRDLLFVRFSDDDQRVVAGGDSGVVRVMDVRGGPPLAELKGHFGLISDAAFLRGRDDIVSVGYDGTLRRWSLLAVARPSSRTPVGRPSPNSDRTRVASAFADGVVRIWSPETGSTRALPASNATQVACSGDGSHVAVSDADDHIRIWNVDSGRSRLVRAPSAAVTTALAIDGSGLRVAFSQQDGPTIIERADGKQRVTLKSYEGEVNALAFSPDDRYLATAGEDKTARVWNAGDGRQLLSLPHNESVVDARYSDDGHFVATATTDGTLRVWPLAGGPPTLLYGHVGQVNTVEFDPSGTRLVSAGADGTVRIWNASGGEDLATLLTSRHNVLGASFSAHGTGVVSSGEHETMQITRCEICGSFSEVLELARSRPKRPLSASERHRLLVGD